MINPTKSFQIQIDQETTYRKKLIEVAMPLEAINLESAREISRLAAMEQQHQRSFVSKAR